MEEALFGNGRPGDVSAQAFELAVFIGFRRDAGMQREASDIAHGSSERFVDGRQGLQGQHLASLRRGVGAAG